jgi:hypothetical protein
MNEHPKTEIFISYRRDGGVDYARMIFLELKGRGYETFFDYNSLRDGRFNEGILNAIDECRYFILVLSDGALDRCVNEDDWVRHEIERAISKGKSIIPVCPSGNTRGFPEKLPPSLEPLRMLQISMLQMDDLFEKSFDKIVEDRFAEDFRGGRAPVSKGDVVTVRSFRKIGVGVIAAIFAASVIIGVAVMRANSAGQRRLKAEAEARIQSEREARLRAEAEAEAEARIQSEREARLRAEAEAEAKARIQSEREARLRAEAEAEAKARIQSEREARIRAEAAASAAKVATSAGKGAVIVQKEGESLRKLLSRETELTTEIAAAQAQVQSLSKELDNLAWSDDADKRWRVSGQKEETSKRIQELTQKLESVREAITRVRAVDEAYRGELLDADAVEEMEKTREELERTVARIVARRISADSLKDRIPADALLRAKQLEGIANAEHKSLADALAKNKAADDAYGELLDKVVEDEIARAMETVDNLPEWSKWKTAVELLAKVMTIDPENERARKAYDEALGCLNPSMTVTAELDGQPVPGVRFFSNGKPVETPFHFVFEDKGGDGGNVKNTGVKLDAVYAKDGKNYSVRGHVFASWKGETNIVLQLRENPAAGTAVRLVLDRVSQGDSNSTGSERDKNKDLYIDFVWCPPGSDVIEYRDSNTEETKRVFQSVDVGFWISRCELTRRQYNFIRDSLRANTIFRGFFAKGEKEREPDDDRPALVGDDEISDGQLQFRSYQTLFRIPSISEWFHAAHFGGFKVTEDDFADYAWSLDNAGTNTSFAVGRKKANKLGLHDVYGNAPEWTIGSVRHWLGLGEVVPDHDDSLATLMGGGCADDYESATDLLSLRPVDLRRSSKNRGGVRLVGRTEFQHETSLVEWVKAIDLLDSGEHSRQKEGMALLAGYATGSPDPSLRALSEREYVMRGGDPAGAGIALSKSVRRYLVARCDDVAELSRFATEDEDANVRYQAYKKLKNPPLDLTARYLARVEDDKESFQKTDAYKIYLNSFFQMQRNLTLAPKEGAEACLHHLALHAVHPKMRVHAVSAVTNDAVLKSVALNDPEFYPACVAISRISDRVLLMEILEEAKRKKIKAAVRDRLKELSK